MKLFYTNGNIKYVYSNGILKKYRPNGRLIFISRYDSKEKLHGQQITYHPNGERKDVQFFMHGKPIDIHLRYHLDGRLEATINYSVTYDFLERLQYIVYKL